MLVTLLAVGMWVHPSAAEIGISIGVGDQPYYDGPTYWENGYEYVWVPGFQRDGRWVHGRYDRHGKFDKKHAKDRHKKKHHGKRDKH